MSADLSPPPSRRSDYSPWNYLLLAPIVLPLLTFLYNHETPRLFGIPFFYWFQMLLAPLAVLASVSAFYLARRTRRNRRVQREG
ncbi:MAG: DUF3311 domain-containing protein [Trebonia sp.]